MWRNLLPGHRSSNDECIVLTRDIRRESPEIGGGDGCTGRTKNWNRSWYTVLLRHIDRMESSRNPTRPRGRESLPTVEPMPIPREFSCHASDSIGAESTGKRPSVPPASKSSRRGCCRNMRILVSTFAAAGSWGESPANSLRPVDNAPRSTEGSGKPSGWIMTRQDGSDPSNDKFEHASPWRKGFLAVGVLGDESGQHQKELDTKVPSIAKTFVQGANLVICCIQIVGKDKPKGHQKSKSIQLVQSRMFCCYGTGNIRQWWWMRLLLWRGLFPIIAIGRGYVIRAELECWVFCHGRSWLFWASMLQRRIRWRWLIHSCGSPVTAEGSVYNFLKYCFKIYFNIVSEERWRILWTDYGSSLNRITRRK